MQKKSYNNGSTFDQLQGYVNPVQDQEHCGSCWAFGACGSMEGAIFKKTGELPILSEQNLIDCEHMSSGCAGGLEIYAFQQAIRAGLNTEEDYPYQAAQLNCRFDSSKPVFKISDYIEYPEGDEEGLTNNLATEGPISIGIDASQQSFQLYKSGVYYDPNCKSDLMNHAVLVVGYGIEGNDDYFQVKNSWGTSWGMEGYVMMARNRDNACGIATDANLPIA